VTATSLQSRHVVDFVRPADQASQPPHRVIDSSPVLVLHPQSLTAISV